MLFNSLEFLLFLPLVSAAYFVLPLRLRWVLLLGASYWFYMAWKPAYVILLLISTGVDYTAARLMGLTSDPLRRRFYLICSLVTNLGMLFWFKYFNFFNDSARGIVEAAGGTWPFDPMRVLLPVGISFYTFQTLSYTIDVYLHRSRPERHAGIFALYVAFFPQLVAGPIERPGRLIPQLLVRHEFDYRRVTDGMKLMAWGFFKKLVIADRVAVYVTAVYASPEQFGAIPALLATFFFAFQIYCDFSGYSDIAIGTAKILGIDLMTNFKRPYFASSIPEFWRRWHISLSTWFRDYLYVPLGGNRVSPARWKINLLIVFLVSGLWHGANWTFVIWGALHGALMVLAPSAGNVWNRVCTATGLARLPRAVRLINVTVTFALVMVSWVFFRAENLPAALTVLSRMAAGGLSLSGFNAALGMIDFALACGAISVLLVIEMVQERYGSVRELLASQPFAVRWTAWYALVISVLLLGHYSGRQEFIYFQF